MGDRLTGEYFPSLIVGGMWMAMAAVFVLVGRPSRTTVWMSVALASTGATFVLSGLVIDNVPEHDVPFWMRLIGATQGMLCLSTAMYIRALTDSIPVANRNRWVELFALPAGCALGLIAAAAYAVFPRAIANDHGLGLFDTPHEDGFYWVVLYVVALGVVFGLGWIAVAMQGVDPGERDRALLFSATVPLLGGSLLVPYEWSIACGAVSLVFGVAGVLRFMTVEGARGVFLARFMSPEVLDVVRTEGMEGVTRSQSLELTAVYCDLRGFTAYAEAVPSKAVIDLLGEYYDALGQVAADAHATIKDYAGDGVLILVGAPIARPDHADAAMELAKAALAACRDVLENWSTGPHPLGLGIGVASGRVTVGAIGSIDRMEYTAVGVPVNLAARLCSSAVSGEILVDQLTADLCSGDGLVLRDPITLKGLSEPQAVFAVVA